MSWYAETGNKCDVVLSSRVRLARSIEGFPMGERLSDEQARELCDRAGDALRGFDRIDFDKLDPVTAAAYAEEHLVSAEFASSKSPRALYKSDAEGDYIMVCEEDHFRIQSITRGYSVSDAYERAKRAEAPIASAFPVAFDNDLGYLTHCPTNLGTAMRASVMMFLPALTRRGSIPSLSRQLSRLGLTVRGMYGEGSEAVCCIYQISNQVTLGISEEETVSKLCEAVDFIIDQERKCRLDTVSRDPESAADACARAYGTLTHARMISCREFMEKFVDVRLAASLRGSLDAGIPESVTLESLDTSLIECQPAVLTLLSGGGEMTPRDRDIRRASLLRGRLGGASDN